MNRLTCGICNLLLVGSFVNCSKSTSSIHDTVEQDNAKLSESLESLEKLLQTKLNQLGGRNTVGISLFPEKTRVTVGWHGRVDPLSTGKLLFLAASLSRTSADDNRKDAIEMFRTSDNQAARRVIDRAGGLSLVNEYARKVIALNEHWTTCKWLSPSSCSNYRFNNSFEVHAALSFLEKLYFEKLPELTSEDHEKIFEWSKYTPSTGLGSWLSEALGSKVIVHKAGFTESQTSELAIVSDGKVAFALVIFVDSSAYGSGPKVLVDLATTVYKYLAKAASL